VRGDPNDQDINCEYFLLHGREKTFFFWDQYFLFSTSSDGSQCAIASLRKKHIKLVCYSSLSLGKGVKAHTKSGLRKILAAAAADGARARMDVSRINGCANHTHTRTPASEFFMWRAEDPNYPINFYAHVNTSMLSSFALDV
jgi:hypothetical protein